MPGDTESEERKKFDARWKEHYRPHTGARRVPPEATRATAEFFWLERARRARAEAEGLRKALEGPYTGCTVAGDLRKLAMLLNAITDDHGVKTYGAWIDWMKQVADSFDAALAREPGE